MFKQSLILTAIVISFNSYATNYDPPAQTQNSNSSSSNSASISSAASGSSANATGSGGSVVDTNISKVIAVGFPDAGRLGNLPGSACAYAKVNQGSWGVGWNFFHTSNGSVDPKDCMLVDQTMVLHDLCQDRTAMELREKLIQQYIPGFSVDINKFNNKTLDECFQPKVVVKEVEKIVEVPVKVCDTPVKKVIKPVKRNEVTCK